MAVTCRWCGGNMDEVSTCVQVCVETVDGALAPVAYGSEVDDWGAASGLRCHDCLVEPGGFHHRGCDVERCPRCGGQVIACECVTGFAGT
jgi:hypothetical protein